METRGGRVLEGVLAAALLFGAAAGSPAAAHEFWLSPSTYAAAAGDTVSLSAFVGTGFRGEPRPYAPSRTQAFTLRAARALDLSRAARPGQAVLARFVAADGGGALVALLSTFAPVALPSGKFDEYLALEGLDGPRAARAGAAQDGTVRERFRRCAKSWIAGSASARALAPVGLPLEIVPLSTPGSGAVLQARVLFEGQPLAGALVRAWRAPFARDARPLAADARDSTGAAAEGRTNAEGRIALATADAGEWLVSVLHMIASRDTAEADWESYWASLTFGREPRTDLGSP